MHQQLLVAPRRTTHHYYRINKAHNEPRTKRKSDQATMGWFTPSRSPYSSHRSSSWYSRPSSTYSTHSHSSYYKRRPRDGYIQQLLRKLKHLLRELYEYARRHPLKIFMAVVVPLISGGALASIARQFGIKLPAALSGHHGGYGSRSYGGGYYGSSGYDYGSGRSEGLNLSSVMSLVRLFT